MLGAAILITALVASPHTGLGISPAEVTGPANSYSSFTVTDTGTAPETVKIQAVELRPVKGGGWSVYGAADHATVSVEEFHLVPRHSHTVKVTINYHDGYAHNIGIMAATVAPTVKNGASVSTSVIAQFRIKGKHNPYATQVTIPRRVAHSGAGFPVSLAAGLASLLVLCIALIVTVAMWRRRRRTKVGKHSQSPTEPYGFIS